jgi:hypothetical protein
VTSAHALGGVPALLDLSSRPLPVRVTRQIHRIPPGERLDCSGSPWPDALVVLAAGCVDLRLASGAGLHLCRGAIFSLRGLTPAVLVPTDDGSAVVITLHRRPEGEMS